MSRRVITIAKRRVTLTNEDKILFPQSKITKGDLLSYYKRIAPLMLPHLHNRALSLHRFPESIMHEGFFQKNASDYFPTWIQHKTIANKTGGSTDYVVCNNTATLMYLTNLATITYHPWLSKIDKINHPDQIIFDLDPSGNASFDLIKWVAKTIKKLLDKLTLTSYIKTTGSRGLHVVVPLKRVHTFESVRAFAHDVAAILAQQHPEKITIAMHKEKRGNKIFLDTLRNAFGQTAVAPYAVRALPGAPVATPIEWHELTKLTSSQQYTLTNIVRRMAQKKDPWETLYTKAHTLSVARKRLSRL